MQTLVKNIGISLLAITLAFLQGCETAEVIKEEPVVITDPDAPRAEAMRAAGNPAEAAELYQVIAERTQPPAKQEYILLAVESWLDAQQPEAAEALLGSLDSFSLSPDHALRKSLAAAGIALARKRGQEALDRLGAEPSETVNPELRKQYYRNQAEALQLTGNPLEGARSLGFLDTLLTDPNQRLDNQIAILQLLGTLSEKVLELFQDPAPDTFSGWMELSRINKYPPVSPEAIQLTLQHWQQNFPGHPAMPELLDQFQQQFQDRLIDLHTLAVFLPQSGPFSKAANVLRDGFLAAYYTTPEKERPQIRFYDSSVPEDVWPLYQQAISEGASVVIGPLSKKSVAQLSYAGELPVPVLALNQVNMDVAPPRNFYQFGLSPEDESRQVAEKAWIDNLSTAVVFTPENDWGNRIYESFRNHWESLGGQIVAHETYPPRENDFTAPIKRLLNLDHSQARHRKLEKLLGKKLAFEPRRRQDADFLMLAAKPDKARSIRPQFQFHRASDLPIYATSHVFTGKPDPRKDMDIEGIRFPDIPWLLEDRSGDQVSHAQLKALFPETNPKLTRLYAMGIDAYRLLPHLLRLQSNPAEILEGATGKLYLDSANQVHRQLVWGEIRNGKPSVIGYVPRIESPSLPEGAPGEAQGLDLAPLR